MTYNEAIDLLFNSLPAFERSGAEGYKPGLERVEKLAEWLGNPQRKYPCVHIAGTNGKGSTAHTLAAIMQLSGFRTGLYTSPHLTDFAERIRVDGAMIPHERVVEFVERYLAAPEDIKELRPTFFELTTMLAFEYFAECRVDFAIIETGLGGRLDATNIIYPMVSVITNVGLDHTDLLGNTVAAIAIEKAGIIKPHCPVVVGSDDPRVLSVVGLRAFSIGARVIVAPREYPLIPVGEMQYRKPDGTVLQVSLQGSWQRQNTATVLATVDQVRRYGMEIPDEAVELGLAKVGQLTGLRGRWTVVSENPLTVYDTGHNPHAWQLIGPMLAAFPGGKHLVVGFVADKDVEAILALMPRDATYYFTQPHCRRALPVQTLAEMASALGLSGSSYDTVGEAVCAAQQGADPADIIFIGGSNYLISEYLQI